jgi:hypothetical protein
MQELRIKTHNHQGSINTKYYRIFYHNKKPRKDLGVGIGGDLTISSHTTR